MARVTNNQVRLKIPLQPAPGGPSAETLWAEPCPVPGTYRLDNAPGFSDDFAFGDIVRAEMQPDGWLTVMALVEPSPWRHFRLFPPSDVSDKVMESVLKTARKWLGASWGKAFWEGGVGVVMLEVPADRGASPLLGALQMVWSKRYGMALTVEEVRPKGLAHPTPESTGG